MLAKCLYCQFSVVNRGRSGAFSDELQPTESFRNVSDPQYEFGTLGGDDMGKAFA